MKGCNLALFDFDGTISFQDTYSPFIYSTISPARLRVGKLLLAPMLLGYKVGLISASWVRSVVGWFVLRGRRENEFLEMGAQYAREALPKVLRPEAMDRIAWHKGRGDVVVVVSASLHFYLRPWCEDRGLQLICSEPEAQDGRLTGRLRGGDCSGLEKARRVSERFALTDFEHVFVYEDSYEEEALLNLATRRFFRWQELPAGLPLHHALGSQGSNPPEAWFQFLWQSLLILQGVLVGFLVMFFSTVKEQVLVAQGVFTCLGILGGAFLLAVRRRFACRALIVLTSFLVIGSLATAFVGDSILGVSRWWKVGPLQLNLFAVVVPLLVAFIGEIVKCGREVVGTAFIVATAGALAQAPDVSQAVAFGCGIGAVTWRVRSFRYVRIIALGSAIFVAFLRDVAIPPVAHVEGIRGLAWAIAPFLGVATHLSALLVLAAPLVLLGSRKTAACRRDLSWGVFLSLLVPLLFSYRGDFPVPVVGFGAAPILGALFSCGWLTAGNSRQR